MGKIGGIDPGITLIAGNGVDAIHPSRIKVTLMPAWQALPDAATQVEIVEQRVARGELRGVWNGTFCNIVEFQVEGPAGLPRLDITLNKARYFEFLATSGVLDADYREAVKSKLMPREFLSREAAVTTPNSKNVNGLPVILTILTDDGMLLLQQRSSRIGIASDVVAMPINENMHFSLDLKKRQRDNDVMSVPHLVRRALLEEAGWKGGIAFSGEPDPSGRVREDRIEVDDARVSILAFFVHRFTAAYGLIGLVELPLTYDEFQRGFKRAKDGGETAGFIPIRFSPDAVAKEIAARNLYDHVGVGSLMALIYKNKTRFKKFSRSLRKSDAND